MKLTFRTCDFLRTIFCNRFLKTMENTNIILCTYKYTSNMNYNILHEYLIWILVDQLWVTSLGNSIKMRTFQEYSNL